jgi:hypothetical protein
MTRGKKPVHTQYRCNAYKNIFNPRLAGSVDMANYKSQDTQPAMPVYVTHTQTQLRQFSQKHLTVSSKAEEQVNGDEWRGRGDIQEGGRANRHILRQ